MMKKTIFIAFMAASSLFLAQEQEMPVKKTFFGVQAGLLGINAYNEYNFSKNFAVRT